MVSRRPSATIFRLVQDHLSDDTIEALNSLQADAKNGNLIGLAFVAVYKGGDYIPDTAGWARENNSTAIGLARVLGAVLEAREVGR